MAPTIFETIELHEGRAVALDRHLDRLAVGAGRLGVSLPARSTLTRAAAEVVAAWGTSPGRLRITVRGQGAPGARTTVHAAPMAVRTAPVDVVVAASVHDERGPTSGIKTAACAAQVVALQRAARAGAAEALFANTRGELCEGASCNVVVHLGGTWCTPPLGSGCLPGITRELLLESARGGPDEIVERTVAMADLAKVDELLLVSTGRHLQPVRALEGRRLPRVDSPAAVRLRTLLRRHRLELRDR